MVVNFSAISVTDNVDQSVTVTSSPRSGSEFSLGVHLVEMEAVDKSGNIGRCTFTVTILGKKRSQFYVNLHKITKQVQRK